jgi:hypothetical protein
MGPVRLPAPVKRQASIDGRAPLVRRSIGSGKRPARPAAASQAACAALGRAAEGEKNRLVLMGSAWPPVRRSEPQAPVAP